MIITLPEVDWRVGQEVTIHSSYQRGWRPAVVVRVGRTLVHVEDHQGNAWKFCKRTRESRDRYGWVETPEITGLKAREAEAVTTIREAGLNFRFGSMLTLEQLEAIAAAVPHGDS